MQEPQSWSILNTLLESQAEIDFIYYIHKNLLSNNFVALIFGPGLLFS